MRVVKTFFKKHIDLDHIVAISDAYITYIPWIGHSRPAVEFSIEFALRDEPMRHTRLLTEKEYSGGMFVMEDGSFVDAPHSEDFKERRTLAETNLQAQIDELIFEWKHKA